MDERNDNLQTLLGDVNLSRAEKHAKYKRKREVFLVFMDIMTNEKVSSDKKMSEKRLLGLGKCFALYLCCIELFFPLT